MGSDTKRPSSKRDSPASDSESPTNDGAARSETPTSSRHSNGHLGSSENHVFSDPSTADYWRLKYEKAGYENRHRFDPSYQWTAEEEKKLVRKVL